LRSPTETKRRCAKLVEVVASGVSPIDCSPRICTMAVAWKLVRWTSSWPTFASQYV